MLKKITIVFFTLLLTLSHAAIARTTEYQNTSECMLVGKSIQAKITGDQSSATSIVTIPDEWVESFSITTENNRLVIRQIKETTDAVPAQINLPTLCDLSCHLTANATVDVVNQPAHRGALNVNLYSGGTITANGGTYTGCSVTIYEHGTVKLTNETIETPVKLNIDGMGTASFSAKLKNREHEQQDRFKTSLWKTYITEGLYIKNGATLVRANHTNYDQRPTKNPIFSPVPLGALAAYAQGTQMPRPLPSTWAQHLYTLEKAGSDLSTVQSADICEKLDIETFGQKIYGLSCQEVREDLLSPKFKDGVFTEIINQSAIRRNPHFKPARSAYDEGAIINKIIFANATPAEKAILWNLFLYEMLHQYTCTYETDSKKILSSSCVSPYQLYEASWPDYATPLRAKIKMFGGGSLVAGTLAALGAGLNLKEKDRSPGIITAFGALGFLAGIIVSTPTVWKDIQNYRNYGQRADIQSFENIEKNLASIIKAYASKMPTHVVDAAENFLKTTQKLQYQTEKGINYALLKQRHIALCEYFNSLEKNALS